MIPFEKAYEIVMGSAPRLGAERVDIEHVLNRILAEDVKSDMDMPPFNKSAMDGYACRRQDLGNELTVVETIQAGQIPAKSVGRSQCAKIMTGAMIPKGADCVIMVELTDQPTPGTVRFTGTARGSLPGQKDTENNICYMGEDVNEGDIVLRKGARITEKHIAVLASVGCVEPCVTRRPKVGIIATGNELVEPKIKPGISQIRNSNSHQLCAQVVSVGAISKYYGIVEDREESIDSMLKKAMGQNDVVLISGGVSVGEFDLVPDILRKNNFRLLFEKIAIKPGMPTIFGVSDEIYCFGLPGNPVSTFVIFELLVKPFLYKMMGHDFEPVSMPMRLDKTISRKKTKRASWLPVAVKEGRGVMPIEYHGSAHVSALCGANGLICVPVGVSEIAEGTIVDVRQI